MADPPPATDARIRVALLGKPKRLDGPVVLVEYDAGWPERFAREADRIHRALGERALRVEHVGSTSVPGLVAKPVIDIVLTVADSTDEPSYVPPLEAAGYLLRIREPHWHQHRLLRGPNESINLHVFSRGSSEIDRMCQFRDRLRTDSVDRDFYARTKRSLASQTWKFTQDYADAKSEVITSILTRAKTSSPSPSNERDR
jgi:GrpB-like predicted nucleotidyltransferase (UPF0157 family)